MEKNGLFSQRIRLRHLHTFVAVAQQGTLGRAAETLNLSQPALSKTLNELEQLTGTRLFERGRLGAQLTVPGEQFLTHAVKVLDALNTAGRISGDHNGCRRYRAGRGGLCPPAGGDGIKRDGRSLLRRAGQRYCAGKKTDDRGKRCGAARAGSDDLDTAVWL